jgi:hypothetical protein
MLAARKMLCDASLKSRYLDCRSVSSYVSLLLHRVFCIRVCMHVLFKLEILCVWHSPPRFFAYGCVFAHVVQARDTLCVSLEKVHY